MAVRRSVWRTGGFQLKVGLHQRWAQSLFLVTTRMNMLDCDVCDLCWEHGAGERTPGEVEACTGQKRYEVFNGWKSFEINKGIGSLKKKKSSHLNVDFKELLHFSKLNVFPEEGSCWLLMYQSHNWIEKLQTLQEHMHIHVTCWY